MVRKLSPEERMIEEGLSQCGNFREHDMSCRQCALHGAYKFCRNYKQRKKLPSGGGLF